MRSPVHSDLKLSGLILQREDHSLRVRNRVYEHVFNEEWVEKESLYGRSEFMFQGYLLMLSIISGLVTYFLFA